MLNPSTNYRVKTKNSQPKSGYDSDDTFDIDTLLSDLKYASFSQEQMKDLLLWLKAYNRTADEKVWLLGFDTNMSYTGAYIDLAYFFCTLNEKPCLSYIDSLCHDLINPKKNCYYQKPVEQFNLYYDQYRDLHDLLNKKEYGIITYNLEMVEKVKSLGGQDVNLLATRDSMMFKNVGYLLDLICTKGEKVVVYGHFGHTNYKHGQNAVRSFVWVSYEGIL